MKNEIGRKITSLTLMTIMFAGGLTLAIPGFLPMAEILPEAYADAGTTEGMLYVSSTQVQGGQVLEIVVSDPASSSTSGDLTPLTVSFNGTDLQLVQVTNGTWVAYLADLSQATVLDALTDTDFGQDCVKTLSSTASGVTEFTVSTVNTFIEDQTCDNGGDGAKDRPFDVLTNEPTLLAATSTDNPGPTFTGQVEIDGQHWPFINTINFNDDNYLTYGDDSIIITYGVDNSGATFEVNGQAGGSAFVVPGQAIHMTIHDNALNIDPTTADRYLMVGTAGSQTTARTSISTSPGTDGSNALTLTELATMSFGDNGYLTINESDVISATDITSETTTTDTYILEESGANTGVFEIHNLVGSSDAKIINACTVDDWVDFVYAGDTVRLVCATTSASVSYDAGAEWMPGEAASYTVNDPDMNRNSVLAETLSVQSDNIIPTVKIGEPKTLKGVGSSQIGFAASDAFGNCEGSCAADMPDGSERVKLTLPAGSSDDSAVLTIQTGWDATTMTPLASYTDGAQMLYYDICSVAEHLVSTEIAITMDMGSDHSQAGDDVALAEPNQNACSGEIHQTSTGVGIDGDAATNLTFTITHVAATGTAGDYVIAADLHSYSTGNQANGIYRMEAVETGANTGIFEGTARYIVMNADQANDTGTFNTPADYVSADSSDIIMMLDTYMTGSSAPRINYGDTDVLGSANTTVGAQLDANTHSGVVSWDQASYAVGDAATLTITDADLNTDPFTVEVYTGQDTYSAGAEIFSLQCDDATCATDVEILLVEDGVDSDTFTGVFTVPADYGKDMEVGYRDTRDASGTATIYYATASVTSTTGTISLDRTVYPTPFGLSGSSGCADVSSTNYCGLKNGDATDETTVTGTVTVTVSVTDPDFTGDTMSASGGLVTIRLITAGDNDVLFTAGDTKANALANDGILGPLTETAQGSGVYELSISVDQANTPKDDSAAHYVLGGSTVIQAQYADAKGDAGIASTQTTSATFDLRNGSLTTDKSVYVIGQTMVLTITDPDLDLDSATAESYSLSLIEWDSSADSSELLSTAAFTGNPTKLEETGDGTGVFQTTVDMPTGVSNGGNANALEMGETITLTYRDAGRAGESHVAGQNTKDTSSVDVEHIISVSNFGATITLDKTVYDWTDTVNIEVVAPDHNQNSAGKELIGDQAGLPIKISTRNGQLCTNSYTLKESSEDSGVFVGYITLAGISGQAINPQAGVTTLDLSARAATCGTDGADGGPENGIAHTLGQDDGITVTFEWVDGSVALASAIIQWNYTQIEFLDSSVAADGSTTIRVTDPDEDLDDTIIDQIQIELYSDSDSGGIKSSLSETGEGTGIFEGTIHFSSNAISSGDTLRVSEGDTVTAEVTDYTLPGPDYTSSDTLLFAATTTVGTAFPPLERAPAANARVVDASGSSVAEVSSGQQVQIAADVSNGQSKDQAFAYLVQVQDASGVTVSLSWLTGSLTSGQSMTAAQSWTPTSSGSYTATVFVWESVSNPTALSPTVSVNIDVV